MSLESWINVSLSIGTAATAFFTYKSAKHAGKMVQNAMRPILIITPPHPSLDTIHTPTIELHNFGQGPGIIDEVHFFGAALGKVGLRPISQSEPIVVRPMGIIGPSAQKVISGERSYEHFFGEREFVKYVVIYRDYTGNVYKNTCEWNQGNGQWSYAD